MPRQKIIHRVQKISDTAGTHISAAETSRVAKLVLDEIDEGMQKLFTGIYWDFHKTKGGEETADKVMKLCDKLQALVQRARRKSRSKARHGGKRK